MEYYELDTEQLAEDLQRYLHYHMSMMPQYNAYVPAEISDAEVQAMYGASKLFLDCTIDECWEEGYNRVLGMKGGEIQTNFSGVSERFATPQQGTSGKWYIPKPDRGTIPDVTGFTFNTVPHSEDLF